MLLFCLAALIAAVESLLYPGRYVLTFQPVAWLIFAVFALILIPIQTSAEEVFFRGYLLQWMGLRLKNKWLLSLLNGLLFFLPHAANPEMAANSLLVGLGYFAIGFFFALITLEDHGMELALGHLPLEKATDPIPRPVVGPVDRVEDRDVEPGLERDLGDARPHRPGAEDADPLRPAHEPVKRGSRFSAKAASPSA